MDIFKMSQFNISDYLQIIFRRKWLFIIPFCTVFFTAGVGSFFLPKVYRSTATLLVEDKQLLSPLVQGMAVASTMQEQLNILTEQITSRSRIEEMISEGKIEGLGKNIKGREKMELFIKDIQERLKITMPQRQIILISFEDINPKIAMDVVNYITESFVQESLSGQGEEADAAINFIKKQVKIYQEKLENSEAALKDFKEKYLLELPGSAGSNLEKTMEAQNALVQLELDLQEAQKTKQMLQKQLSREEKIITSKTTTSTNPLIEQLSAKLVELQTQLSELKAKKCTDEHPLVISLKNSIAKIEERIKEESVLTISNEITETNPIYQELASKLHDTEILIDSLMARKKQLESISIEYEKKAKNVPAHEEEYTRLTRDMGVNETIYAMLLNRLETANISRRLEQAERGTRFKVIDPARFPIYPVKPNKRMIIFLGFIIGSILGFGCIFLGEYSDHSFRGLEDVESVLAIPSLGSISKIVTVEDINYLRNRHKSRIILTSIIIISILLVSLFVFLLIK